MHVWVRVDAGFRQRLLVAAALAILLISALAAWGASSAAAQAPIVTIEDATDVEFTTAAVSGTVDPDGNETSYRFEAATEADFSNVSVSGGFGSVPADAGVTAVPPPGELLTGLAPETTYHLRLVAESPDGTDIAVAPGTFTTKGPVELPSVSLEPVADFGAATAHFEGTINPGSTEADPGFGVNWHFECTPACPSFPGESGFIAADEADHPIEADVKGLQPNVSYTVKLVATNAGGSAEDEASFKTTAVAPYAQTLPAFALEGGSQAILGARVNAANEQTVYWFEYGPTAAYGQQSTPTTAEGGQTDFVTQAVSGLQPGTVYHFRVLAENATGETAGNDKTFVAAPASPAAQSCQNQALREQNRSTGLPDCRAYEQVTPPAKNGYDAGTGGLQAAADGNGLASESYGAFSDENQSALIVNPYLSKRTASGWTTTPLGPPVTSRPNAGFATLFGFYSANLEFAGVASNTGESLAPNDDPTQENIYWRDNSDGAYTTLTVLPNGDRIPCGNGRCVVVGATPDLQHVLFQADEQVWQWDEGTTQRISILPGEVPAANGKAGPLYGGYEIGVNTHLISDDGTRSVFSYNDGETGAVELFMRVDGDHTVEIGKSERASPDPSPNFSIFVGASADLSRVFFLDSRALTDDAPVGSQSLYMYEVESDEVTNLSADSSSTEDGAPIAEMVGSSDDGSYVYFLSQNQLIEGQEGVPGEYSIYLWHEGDLSLAVPGVEIGPNAVRRSQDHVSADGRFLLHGDSTRLTAYDNRDAAAETPVREYYLYDSTADRLTCVSCKTSGERPEGTPDGGSSIPDNPPRQGSHVPIAISDDGSRVFFQSRDSIVPEDVNGKQDAYMWEQGSPSLVSTGQSGDPSSFVGASRSGDDVFFVTRERIVPTDQDNNLDVYDARVGGGFPYLAPPPPCEGESGCRGPAGSARPGANPATETFDSDVRPLDPARQRLKKALRACKQKPIRKARAKCRKRAKKRYRAGTDRRAGR